MRAHIGIRVETGSTSLSLEQRAFLLAQEEVWEDVQTDNESDLWEGT